MKHLLSLLTITIILIFSCANDDDSNSSNKAPTYRNVTIMSTQDGIVVPAGKQAVVVGDSLEIRATPNNHFEFSYWKQIGTTPVKLTDSIANQTYIKELWEEGGALEAHFVPVSCSVTIIHSDSATIISPQGSFEKGYGSNFLLYAVPQEGYRFMVWQSSDMDSLFVEEVTDESTVVKVLGSGWIKPLFLKR